MYERFIPEGTCSPAQRAGQFVGGLVLTFVLVVAPSYVGTEVAFRSFFGWGLVDPDSGEFALLDGGDPGETDG